VAPRAIDDLGPTIDDLSAVYQTTPVEIDAGHGPAESSAGRLGLSLDVASSAREVEEANQVGSVLTRPVEWVGSFFRDEDVAPRYTLDETVLHDALVEVDLPGITGWTLPDLQADADGVRVVAGQPGAGIDLDGFGDRLLAAADTGEVPIRVTPDLIDLPPPVDDDDLEPVLLRGRQRRTDRRRARLRRRHRRARPHRRAASARRGVGRVARHRRGGRQFTTSTPAARTGW
jgi:hypothetical protein